MTNYNVSGPPSDLLGVAGDFAFDNANKFCWGPKSDTSWAGTAMSIGGPPGPQGPPTYLPPMGKMGNIFGPSACFNGQTMGTVAQAANSVFFWPGTSTPNVFVPTVNCYLTGLSVTNYGSTGATVYFYLQDLTANNAAFGYNGGNGIANGTIVGISYGATTYPLIAGHRYQWQGIRASAGATTMQINPIISYPSGSPAGLSVHHPFVVNTTTTAAKAASVATVPPGILSQTAYYRTGSAATYLYYVDLYISGSGVCDPYILNATANANQCDLYYANNNTYITLSSTLTRYTFGPFAPSAYPFPANSTFTFNLYAPSASITVNQCYMQMTVGQ